MVRSRLKYLGGALLAAIVFIVTFMTNLSTLYNNIMTGGFSWLKEWLSSAPWLLIFVSAVIGAGILAVVGNFVLPGPLKSQLKQAVKNQASDEEALQETVRHRMEESRKQCNTYSEHLQKAIRVLRDGMQEILYEWNMEHFKNNHRLLEKEMERITGKSCDSLERLLTEYTGNKISACVKIMYSEKDKKLIRTDSIDEAFVATLCRGSNSHSDRFNNVVHPVKGNTDFEELWEGRRPFFAANGLDKLPRSEYDNTSKYFPKYYKSAFVVPIRASNPDEDPETRDYEVLGFLCTDSVLSDGFPESDFETIGYLLRSVASMLYVFLDLCTSVEEEVFPDQ